MITFLGIVIISILGIVVLLLVFEGLARGLGLFPGKTLDNWNLADWNDDSRGVDDRRNIAAAYIDSLPDTTANQEAIDRLITRAATANLVIDERHGDEPTED